MKNIRYKLLLLLFSLLCLSQEGLSGPTEDFQNRARRVLADSSLVNKNDAEIKKYCVDEDIDIDKLLDNFKKEKKDKADFKFYYDKLSDEIEKYLRSDDDGEYMPLIKAGLATPLIIPLILLVLCILSALFMLFWCLGSICCCKYVKEPASTQKRKKCLWVGLGIFVVAIIMIVVWMIFYYGVVKNTKDIRCAAAINYYVTVQGLPESPDHIQFLGLNGLENFTNFFKTSVDEMKSGNLNDIGLEDYTFTAPLPNPIVTQSDEARPYVKDVAAIRGDELAKKLDDMPQKINDSLKFDQYVYPGTSDSSKTVVMKAATDFKDDLETWAKDLVLTPIWTTSIYKIGDASKQLLKNSQQLDDASSGIENFKKQIDKVRNQFVENYYRKFNPQEDSEERDYLKYSDRYGVYGLLLPIPFVLATLVLYLCVCCSAKHKESQCTRFLSRCTIFLFTFFLVLFSVLCIIFTMLSASSGYICFSFSKIYNDKSYPEKYRGDISNSTVNLFENCIFKDGSGKLQDVASSGTSTQIDNIDNFTSGLNEYINKTTDADLPAMRARMEKLLTDSYNQILMKDANLLADEPTAENIKEGIAKFAPFACQSDSIKGYDTIAKPSTTNADTTPKETIGNSYTILLHAVGSLGLPETLYDGRYTALQGCTSTTFTQGNEYLKRMLTSGKAYYSKAKQLYNTDLLDEKLIWLYHNLEFINTYDPKVKEFTTKLTKTVEELNKLPGAFSTLSQCSVFQKALLMVDEVLCDRVNSKIGVVTWVGVTLGFIGLTLSWLWCCTVNAYREKEPEREPEKKEEKYVEKDEEAQKESNSLDEEVPDQNEKKSSSKQYSPPAILENPEEEKLYEPIEQKPEKYAEITEAPQQTNAPLENRENNFSNMEVPPSAQPFPMASLPVNKIEPADLGSRQNSTYRNYPVEEDCDAKYEADERIA